jgi:hypothetical protein
LEEQAVLCATRKKNPSDRLLMFLLRGRRSDVFGNKLEHRHGGRVVLQVEQLGDDELERIAAAGE